MTFTTSAVDALGSHHGNAFFTCPACKKPVALKFGTVSARRTVGGSSTPQSPANELHSHWNGTIGDAGYLVFNVWPVLEVTKAPDSVPEAISRNFIQAEDARRRHHREAAGMTYRRVLELALKDVAPDLTGTLAKRIDKLANASKLTPDLATWAHSVRQLGNEAAHDEPEPTETDLDDLGAFTRVLLEYLYTMPAKVRKPEEAADVEDTNA